MSSRRKSNTNYSYYNPGYNFNDPLSDLRQLVFKFQDSNGANNLRIIKTINNEYNYYKGKIVVFCSYKNNDLSKTIHNLIDNYVKSITPPPYLVSNPAETFDKKTQQNNFDWGNPFTYRSLIGINNPYCNLELLVDSVMKEINRNFVSIEEGLALVCEDPNSNPNDYQLYNIRLIDNSKNVATFNDDNVFIVSTKKIISNNDNNDNTNSRDALEETVKDYIKRYIDFTEISDNLRQTL